MENFPVPPTLNTPVNLEQVPPFLRGLPRVHAWRRHLKCWGQRVKLSGNTVTSTPFTSFTVLSIICFILVRVYGLAQALEDVGFCFVLFLRIYLFRETEAEIQAEGEAGSMQGALPRTPSRVSRITPWAAGCTNLLGHQGCRRERILSYSQCLAHSYGFKWN